MKNPTYALQPFFTHHLKRNPDRRGGCQPPTDAALRHDPPIGLWPIHLDAPRAEGVAERGADSSRGDGPLGGAGSLNAGGATSGPVGAVRLLDCVAQR